MHTLEKQELAICAYNTNIEMCNFFATPYLRTYMCFLRETKTSNKKLKYLTSTSNKQKYTLTCTFQNVKFKKKTKF